VVSSFEHLVLEPEFPDTAQARGVLRSYMDDVVSRYYGRQATSDEIDAALREDPSDDLIPPQGLFLLPERMARSWAAPACGSGRTESAR